MSSGGNDAEGRRGGRHGAHRARRKPSALSRTVVIGGAAACIGVGVDLATPTADALSMIFPGFGFADSDGTAHAIQINILEGNLLNPQFGMGDNVSNNTLIGNAIIGFGNGGKSEGRIGSADRPLSIGGAQGNGNTTQINILSFNIINPQGSIFGSNTSNNTTVNNVAAYNGNEATATGTASGGSLFGNMFGNGNATQLAFFSGNIFNPQFSFGGQNISNNIAATNIAAYNGNGSITNGTNSAPGSLFGAMTGNGNVFQGAAFVSNIFNPQFSSGNGNTSDNTATTNDSTGNGGGSSTTTTTTGGGINVGSTGNGNSTQTATGSSNIYNDQWNIGIASLGRPSTPAPSTPAPTATQKSGAALLEETGATSAAPGASPSTSARKTARPSNPVRNVIRTIQKALKPPTKSQVRAPGTTTTGATGAPDNSTTPAGGSGPQNDPGSGNQAGTD